MTDTHTDSITARTIHAHAPSVHELSEAGIPVLVVQQLLQVVRQSELDLVDATTESLEVESSECDQ